jgi:hypothetical protein
MPGMPKACAKASQSYHITVENGAAYMTTSHIPNAYILCDQPYELFACVAASCPTSCHKEANMRLLNTITLSLVELIDEHEILEYAILSHTWGEEEVLFEDIQELRENWRKKKGSAKVNGFCKIAAKHGFEWIWIDTCCM